MIYPVEVTKLGRVYLVPAKYARGEGRSYWKVLTIDGSTVYMGLIDQQGKIVDGLRDFDEGDFDEFRLVDEYEALNGQPGIFLYDFAVINYKDKNDTCSWRYIQITNYELDKNPDGRNHIMCAHFVHGTSKRTVIKFTLSCLKAREGIVRCSLLAATIAPFEDQSTTEFKIEYIHQVHEFIFDTVRDHHITDIKQLVSSKLSKNCKKPETKFKYISDGGKKLETTISKEMKNTKGLSIVFSSRISDEVRNPAPLFYTTSEVQNIDFAMNNETKQEVNDVRTISVADRAVRDFDPQEKHKAPSEALVQSPERAYPPDSESEGDQEYGFEDITVPKKKTKRETPRPYGTKSKSARRSENRRKRRLKNQARIIELEREVEKLKGAASSSMVGSVTCTDGDPEQGRLSKKDKEDMEYYNQLFYEDKDERRYYPGFPGDIDYYVGNSARHANYDNHDRNNQYYDRRSRPNHRWNEHEYGYCGGDRHYNSRWDSATTHK